MFTLFVLLRDDNHAVNNDLLACGLKQHFPWYSDFALSTETLIFRRYLAGSGKERLAGAVRDS